MKDTYKSDYRSWTAETFWLHKVVNSQFEKLAFSIT